MADDALGPYRGGQVVARYLCVACHRSLSTVPGRCPSCGVDRLSLDREDVRAEVRTYAEEKLQKRDFNEEAVIFAVSLVGSLLLMVPASFVLPFLTGRLFVYSVAGFSVVVRWAILRSLTRLYPQSAILAMAARRRRLAQQLSMDQRALQLESSGLYDGDLGDHAKAVDPELADLNELLRSIGAKLDG